LRKGRHRTEAASLAAGFGVLGEKSTVNFYLVAYGPTSLGAFTLVVGRKDDECQNVNDWAIRLG
jgi:hypothetical protein